MASTRIQFDHNRLSRIEDAGDLAELLFPGNRNQQHCFLVLWFTLKWHDRRLVPNLGRGTALPGVSRRTLERVRAKLRRLGLLDHVTRFSARHGYRDGWVLSSRFENGLRQLADKVATFRATAGRSQEKEQLLIDLAAARCTLTRFRDEPTQSRPETPVVRGETQ